MRPGVFEHLADVGPQKRLPSLQAEEDDAGVRDVVDDLEHLLGGHVRRLGPPDVAELAARVASLEDLEGAVEREAEVLCRVVGVGVPERGKVLAGRQAPDPRHGDPDALVL